MRHEQCAHARYFASTLQMTSKAISRSNGALVQGGHLASDCDQVLHLKVVLMDLSSTGFLSGYFVLLRYRTTQSARGRPRQVLRFDLADDEPGNLTVQQIEVHGAADTSRVESLKRASGRRCCTEGTLPPPSLCMDKVQVCRSFENSDLGMVSAIQRAPHREQTQFPSIFVGEMA